MDIRYHERREFHSVRRDEVFPALKLCISGQKEAKMFQSLTKTHRNFVFLTKILLEVPSVHIKPLESLTLQCFSPSVPLKYIILCFI